MLKESFLCHPCVEQKQKQALLHVSNGDYEKAKEELEQICVGVETVRDVSNGLGTHIECKCTRRRKPHLSTICPDIVPAFEKTTVSLEHQKSEELVANVNMSVAMMAIGNGGHDAGKIIASLDLPHARSFGCNAFNKVSKALSGHMQKVVDKAMEDSLKDKTRLTHQALTAEGKTKVSFDEWVNLPSGHDDKIMMPLMHGFNFGWQFRFWLAEALVWPGMQLPVGPRLCGWMQDPKS